MKKTRRDKYCKDLEINDTINGVKDRIFIQQNVESSYINFIDDIYRKPKEDFKDL